MKKSPVPAAMLTSGEVARMLGITRHGVLALDRRGKLTPTRSVDGRRLYSRGDVLEYARVRGTPRTQRHDGVVSAKVFECFDLGMTLPAIVQLTKQSPAMIRTLYEEYRAPLERPRAQNLDSDELHTQAAAFVETVAAIAAKGRR